MHETSKRSLPPGTLLQENRGRWETEEGHLERFRGDTVSGGRQRKDTWNAFAGKPWQVEGKKRHLEHFHRKTVPGGRRDGTPGTLSREFRARWKAGKNTWNAFAGIPCQVDGRKGHLTRFCGNTVPGGR